MTGLSRLFYAALAAVLRSLASGPIGLGDWLVELAAKCEARAKLTGED